MNEWCPDCESENYEILEEQTDFEIVSVSIWRKCQCVDCSCKFEIYRTYNLDPYYSYTRKWSEEE